MESYATVGTIEASRDGAPLHLAVFDPTEELLWTASQAGMVYSHLLPTAEPYSAFRADEQMPVVALFPHPFGVITLNHDRVRFFSKGGMKLQEAVDRSPHRPKQPDMHPNPSPNRLAHPPESSPPTHHHHCPSPPAPIPPTGSRLSAVCGGALYPPTSNKGAPHLACAMAPRDGPPVLGLLDMRASTSTLP